jgi:GNAT superfamily N-acetyltransferase
MDLEIRVASATDLEALVRLAAAFRDYLGHSTPSDADLRESIAMLLKAPATEFFLACDARQTALAYVQCRYRREERRRGVGRRLMEFAMARALARGCRSIGLNTNERNEGALALYQQLGLVCERALWKGGRQLWLQKLLATS